MAPFFSLVRGWTVTPRAPALAPRVPMVRLSQAAPAEAGAGVRHSLPLLKLLKLLIRRLTYVQCIMSGCLPQDGFWCFSR